MTDSDTGLIFEENFKAVIDDEINRDLLLRNARRLVAVLEDAKSGSVRAVQEFVFVEYLVVCTYGRRAIEKARQALANERNVVMLLNRDGAD